MKKLLFILTVMSMSSILLASGITNKSDIVREEVIEVEKWMTKSFYNEIEQTIEIEEWMTGPLVAYRTSVYSTSDDFVILKTTELFPFQGDDYEVYRVYYNDPSHNISIAVNKNSYIVYTSEFMIFYEQSKKNGFGVRSILFTSPEAKDKFSSKNFSLQMILVKSRKLSNFDAINLIACYVPQLKLEIEHV